MNFLLKVWALTGEHQRKNARLRSGEYFPNTSFLEMLDIVNEQLVTAEKNRSRSIRTAGKAFAALLVDD